MTHRHDTVVYRVHPPAGPDFYGTQRANQHLPSGARVVARVTRDGDVSPRPSRPGSALRRALVRATILAGAGTRIVPDLLAGCRDLHPALERLADQYDAGLCHGSELVETLAYTLMRMDAAELADLADRHRSTLLPELVAAIPRAVLTEHASAPNFRIARTLARAADPGGALYVRAHRELATASA